MPYRILCVDTDQQTLAETVAKLRADLSGLDLDIESAGTLAEAEKALRMETDVIITEYDLPDGTGFELVETAQEVAPDAGTILYTGIDPGTLDSTELRGAITEYVGKGSVFGEERLTDLVQTTIENRSQSSYPIPQDEPERLAALRSYDLDDEALMDSLDRITDLAATYFDVEQASINVINEHSQEFLACYGNAENWESLDRENSICTFTILDDDGVMAVEDVREDPRFEPKADLLVGMGIRSYMGANLVTSNGLVIGPLCIYDDEPRSFSPADEEYLRTLATLAMDFIDLYAQLNAVLEGNNE